MRSKLPIKIFEEKKGMHFNIHKMTRSNGILYSISNDTLKIKFQTKFALETAF